MNKGGSFLINPVAEEIFTRERFSEEQREIDSMVREFARDKILPRKDDLNIHNRELSLELLREVAELGLTGIDIPEKYGGMELDKTTSALVAEALSVGGSASWVVTFSAHVGIGSLPIVFFGNEAQKEKYLPRLATAETLAAYALTEPQAGSDALSIATTATLSLPPLNPPRGTLSNDGETFVLNGTKQYVTNGGWADLYIVFAKLDGLMSAFIVERDSPGFTVGPEEDKMGIRGSSTTSLFLDNVPVPRDNLLGKPGDGLQIALNILNIGRFKLGAADLGGCKVALDLAIAYALERRQFGQPIAFFDAIRKKLADMTVRAFVLDSVIYRTVGLMDELIATLDPKDRRYGDDVMAALEEYAIESSIAKILGSETISKVADHGVQIYGGYGFSEDFPMAGVYRDCRIDRLFEGTNEINRMVIYGYYLKKALVEELPLREAERSWAESGEDHPAFWGLAALDVARRLSVKYLHQAITLYGQDLRNEEIVGEDIADLVIAYYGASSALNRILQHGDMRFVDRPVKALARLVVASYLEEWSRLSFRLRPVLFADSDAADREILEQQARKLELPFNPVREVHVLTDDLYHHGHYRFN